MILLLRGREGEHAGGGKKKEGGKLVRDCFLFERGTDFVIPGTGTHQIALING
jgi:hypothetical protein